MSKRVYLERWRDPRYVGLVWALYLDWHLDSCSVVPDIYDLGCLEHDAHYRLHRDLRSLPMGLSPAEIRERAITGSLGGRIITRLEGDTYFWWFMAWKAAQDEWWWRPWHWTTRLRWWYGLRVGAERAWETGPDRLRRGRV